MLSNLDRENNDEFEQILSVVFKLVKSGSDERLRDLLSTLKEETLQRVFDTTAPKENGATPFLIASREGHLKIVELLLEKGADPLVTGTMEFDGETITRVPPLWAAAAVGHLPICRLLVSKGVDVNQTTNTNSTPLRGACYDGYLEIVKFLVENGADIEIANRHGHTALMIASYRAKADVVRYLLSVGAQIDRTSSKGNTALHDAAESGNLEILKMLVDAGAKLRSDDYGVTPLLSAALCGHVDLMRFLFSYSNNQEKHDAWKLLGATFIDKQMDVSSGIACWRHAFDSDIWNAEQQADFIPELDEVQSRVYADFREAKSLNDVDQLVGDPDSIRMQALLIRERILSDSHPDTHHYLRLRGAYYLDVGSWNRTWELWSYILQLEQFYHQPISLATGSTFCAFYDAFNIIVEDLMIRPDRRLRNHSFNPSIEQVAVVLERAVFEAERHLFSDAETRKKNIWIFDDCTIQQEVENLLGLCLHFIHLISRVNLVNISMPDSSSKSGNNNNNNNNNVRLASVLPARNNIGRSEGSNSQSLNSNRNLSNSNNANCFSQSPVPSPQSVLQAHKQKSKMRTAINHPSYIITNTIPQKCPSAYLPTQLEAYPKFVEGELQPRCPHLKCLVNRMFIVFSRLSLRPLHLACEEREANEELEPAPRIPSNFVIEKLLNVGANPAKSDEKGNTALHILLANKAERFALVKLLLEGGAPLFARNKNDETCLEIVHKNKQSLLRTIRIGRYISLKQIAANVVKRNGLNLDELPSELALWLANF